MFLIDKDATMNAAVLSQYIQDFTLNKQSRLKKLKRYYKADNAVIKDRLITDPNRPNYKIAHSFASHITDTHTGYFMGAPIKYSSEDETAVEKIKEIYDYNDEMSHNLRLERDASIYGIAYELLWVQPDGKIRFKDVDPRNSFMIHANDLEQDPVYFVRMYGSGAAGNESWTIELYDDTSVSRFRVIGNSILGSLEPIDSRPHGFGDVPVSVYNNNRDRMGDFERVIPMIDAYDSITSNTLNDLENFADAYLVFKNVDLPEEEMADMRKNRIISYNDSEGNAEIEWLTKAVMDGGAWEGSQAKIEEQIYTLSATPNFTDENFGSYTSDISLKYKLLSLEQKASIKEREFRVGIMRRIELINNLLSLLGNDVYTDINLTFSRTLPVDIRNEMEILATGHGLVSQETLFGQVSFIEDPAAEAEALARESSLSLDFDFMNDIEDDE